LFDRYRSQELHVLSRQILDEHLRRLGVHVDSQEDPQAHLQLTTLSMFLEVLAAALADEATISLPAAHQVLGRVVYGCVPQRPATERYLQMQQLLFERTQMLPMPADRLGSGTAP
jgi:hypothetical protein